MRILAVDPKSTEAGKLMEKLSLELLKITGNDGTSSVQTEDFLQPRSIFVIAYDEMGNALGCGGIRPLDEETGEVKRMFATIKTKGVGTQILSYLENWAKETGFQRLILETRAVNGQATTFYLSKGYERIDNYGKYRNRPEAVCFGKWIG